MKTGYIIGALKNPEVTKVAKLLRSANYEIVDDWFSAGPEADEIWRQYEVDRGRSYKEALVGIHAQYAFQMDYDNLKRADFAVLVLPAGKSAHLELGWFLGQGKPAWVLFDKEPERFDLMYKFATGICYDCTELFDAILTHEEQGELVF